MNSVRQRPPVSQIAACAAFLLVLAAILALGWWAYRPGLSGDFLFDDFANLPTLGATGPVDHCATFWRYITSGDADPTGRPLTLLTFLIDARNWPANPYPFKVTNVILHLINGALLAWVLWRLGWALLPSNRTPGSSKANSPAHSDVAPTEPPRRLVAREARSYDGPASVEVGRPAGCSRWSLDHRSVAIAALFGAGAWLLHPLFVSATLYIVQREAMLPATFVLIGMLGWMASREALAHGHVKRALAGMALSAWLCTALAVLSKANGALFPILLMLTEWIVLAPYRPMPTAAGEHIRRRAVLVFLVLPSIAVVAYLLSMLPGAIRGAPAIRGWTVGERLLTEPRVITDYLRLLFIPHIHSTGLFNDQFAISTGWLHPSDTLPSILLILALIGAGFALRKRHPAIALALIFYFAAQLMESGWIPLELYFEHRNYLPALLLFWPIGLALGMPGTLRFLKIAAAACILLVLAGFTWQRATLWGDGFRQAQVWAAINPKSARAQTNAALYDLRHDRPRLAAARLQLALPLHPDDIQIPVNLISAECRLGGVSQAALARADYSLARTRLGGQVAFKWFNDALTMAERHTCDGLGFAALQGTLDAARKNPHWRDVRGREQDLAHLQGELDLAEGKPQAALAQFDRALAAAPNPGAALQQAAYLGAHGYPQLGLQHLDYFATLPPGPKPGFGMPRIHAWVLREQGWWPKETAYLRHNLEQAVADKAAQPHTGRPAPTANAG